MITASVHEPDSVIALLKSEEEVKVANITPGDYVFPPVGIERKTYSDFLQSLKMHRLFDQLGRLKECYVHAYLIIEEPFLMSMFASADKPSIIPYRVLLHLEKKGITTIFSASPEHTAQIILLIHKRTRRQFPRLVNSPARYLPRTRTLDEERLHFLQGIPGVGIATARRILDNNTAISSFLAASELDQKKIIGRGKTRHLRQVLGLPIRTRRVQEK